MLVLSKYRLNFKVSKLCTKKEIFNNLSMTKALANVLNALPVDCFFVVEFKKFVELKLDNPKYSDEISAVVGSW